MSREQLLSTGKYVGALVTLLGTAWFMFGHFDSSAETEERSKETEKKVAELVEIRINQDTAETARLNLMKELCLAGTVTKVRECSKVGVDVRE